MASHSIKVSEEVQDGLQQMQRPRESYSEIIERLLLIKDLFVKVLPYLDEERVRLQKKVDQLEDNKQ